MRYKTEFADGSYVMSTGCMICPGGKTVCQRAEKAALSQTHPASTYISYLSSIFLVPETSTREYHTKIEQAVVILIIISLK